MLIELGSQELASCAITARPPQHDTTGARHRAFDVFQGSCYIKYPSREDASNNDLNLHENLIKYDAGWYIFFRNNAELNSSFTCQLYRWTTDTGLEGVAGYL